LAPPKDFFKTPEDNLMLQRVIIAGATFAFLSANAMAQSPGQMREQCSIPDIVVRNVQNQLAAVIKLDNGGFFNPNKMWSAIVDRKGVLCSVINTGTPPASDPWPGSRSIAIAKASTANDFSNDQLALSTANLYGLSLPATDAAEPPLDPPGTRSRSCGFRVTNNPEFSVDDPMANSSRLVFPMMMAPALVKRFTAVAV